MMTLKTKLVLVVLVLAVLALNIYMVLDGCWLEYGGKALLFTAVITIIELTKKLFKKVTNPS